MKTKFNEEVQRRNTSSVKWDGQSNKDALPFWIADSDYMTISPVVKQLTKVSKSGVFGYNLVPTLFYKSIARWYAQNYKSKVQENWIIPATGVVLQIRVLLDILTNEGDGVILQTPVYHTFHKMIQGMNRHIVENKLIEVGDTYQMDYFDLEKKLKEGCKVILLCSPHNPVGRIWTFAELKRVANLAKKYNAYVISDEIHSDLNVTDYKFTSMIDCSHIHEQLMVCNAPSKAFNIAGLHTAYCIVPNPLLKQKIEEKMERDCLNEPDVFGYSACIAAYQKGKTWIKEQNQHIKNNYEYLKSYLNQELPLAKVTQLEGTYLVWLGLTYTGLSSQIILEKCAEKGVTFSSGYAFGKDYDGYLRINLACPLSQLKEGLHRLVVAVTENAIR